MHKTLLLARLYIFCCIIVASHGMPSRCSKGSFLEGGQCQLCPAGTYQNATDATSCRPCPRGHYFPYRGGQSVAVCRACPENTFLDKMGATSEKECKQCPKGTKSPEGSFGCLSCPRGKFPSLCRQATDFIGCCGGSTLSRLGVCISTDSSFSILITSQELFCEVCNFLTCECPGGMFTKDGICMKCPRGTESRGGQVCTPCRNFQVPTQDANGCESCPAGLQGNKRIGATRCVPCPLGTFRSLGDSSCKDCKARENTFIRGAASCQRDETPCASNFFRTRIGTCEQCTREERYDKKLNKCVLCRPNESSLGGVSTRCTRCSQGAVGSREGCVCGPGFEIGTNGKCQPCQPGTVRPAEDVLDRFNAFCEPCKGANFIEERGAVASRPGMKECTPCPAGTRQDDDGQAKCNRLNCGKDLVLNSEKSECVLPATNCPPGSEAALARDLAFACQPSTCPPGSFKDEAIGSLLVGFCRNCRQGEVLGSKNGECKPCENGSVSDGLSDTKCKKCVSGFSASDSQSNCICGNGRQVVNRKCVECPKGSFRMDISADRCLPCPAGTVVSSNGGMCNPCPAGQFSAAGATKCKPCPAGTTTFGRGEANCVRVSSL